jgi:ParB-like chromosome segregation protein Spo0J
MVSALIHSVEQTGQLIPVITVKESDFCFVLIDGYLRVAALNRCGKDTVLAEIWPCKEQEALIRVLLSTRERKWEILEQALVIRELKNRHNLSQIKIAHLLGYEQSWVSRRLTLLEALSDEILELVQKGRISAWSATRVLVPMARAIPEHAEKLTETLLREPISTRDLGEFFHHYQKANRSQREKMVSQPQLFLKALRTLEQEEQAGCLKDGPEGKWLKDLKVVGHILRSLIKDLPSVIYSGQSSFDRKRLLVTFKGTKKLFLALDQNMRRYDDST